MENILQFVRPELFILIAVMWCVGLFLKMLPVFTMEWLIPFLIWLVSVGLAVVYIAIVIGEGFTAVVLVVGFIQGTLIAATAVFGNELIKQGLVKRVADKKG